MLAAQRSVQEPYLDLLYSPERAAGGEVTSTTLGGGLARRACDLFWPIAAEAGGFAYPDQPPVFLSLETSQYYMAHIVRPLLEEGYFESVTMDRNRMYSQILDNLNKAAIVGFPHTEIAARLDAAYFGDPAQRRGLCRCTGMQSVSVSIAQTTCSIFRSNLKYLRTPSGPSRWSATISCAPTVT
jgi:hypothetical protein